MILAQTWSLSFSASMLLAVVATLGYLVGRRAGRRRAKSRDSNRHEIARALAVAHELESIAYRLRKALDAHIPAVMKFNTRLKRCESTAGHLLARVVRSGRRAAQAGPAVEHRDFARLRRDPAADDAPGRRSPSCAPTR